MPQIKDLPLKHLMQGIAGRYIHGSSMSVGEVFVADGSRLPVHQHPHEQITFILEGELEMQIGDETVFLTPGMYFVIPSNTPHGAFAHGDCKAIDVFAPVREDYR